MRWHEFLLVGVGQQDLAGSLVVATPAVVVDEGIWREQVFQQAANPLPTISDRAFSGAHQLGDAGVGVAVGGQADDKFVGLYRVPVAGQLVLREASCLSRFKEHTFQDLVGEPVEAQDIVVGGCGRCQPFARQVATVVQRCVQGEGGAGVSAKNLAVEVLLGSLVGADEVNGDRRGEAQDCWNLGLMYENWSPEHALALMKVCLEPVMHFHA